MINDIQIHAQRKIALVTGASRGIGLAIAENFAQQGFMVIGTSTTELGVQTFNDRLNALNVNNGSKGMVLNVNDIESVNKTIENIAADFGVITILVNNAGITSDQIAIRMKENDWDTVIATNLSAVGRMCRVVLRGMIKQKYGRIINITSVVGFTGNPGQTNYAAAKAGVVGMSKALAREVASRNITVNCIAPGFIDTDMTKKLTEAQISSLLNQIPAGRLGTANDIAEAVNFLASPQAGYVTGTTLHVNGGMFMS